MATLADTPESVTDDPTPDAAPADARRAGRARRNTLRVLVAAATAGLVATVVLGVAALRSDRAREAHRQSLVDAARDGVLALIDVHAATADADLARLMSLSTGVFADEMKEGGTGFVGSVRDSAVNSDGRVDEAALASESGSSGVVVVAASARVANAAGPASNRTYRLRVAVDEVGGRMLMSSVEFVP
ncbi:hypothetical protein [Rhodococcus sp. NPDC127528]|uniref:hypothetical protein n=1 Tax=unclassified Rhodococcus (in: high G+C Gram-positive bacteria) TaxID=192944 RepID=UPI00363F4DD0